MQVVVHVDGGARGNPGPAAAAAVVSAPDGRVLDEAAVTLGRATNNVAEYRGLLLGLERAAALGATEVDVVNDSELVARQVDGDYKVKNADLKPLHAAGASTRSARFERWSIRSVPRAENAAADALVNRALDGEGVAGEGAPEGLWSRLARVERLLRRQIAALEREGLREEQLAGLLEAYREVEELRPPRGAR